MFPTSLGEPYPLVAVCELCLQPGELFGVKAAS